MWADHVLPWWEHRNDPHILFLKYEDLKRVQYIIVLRICSVHLLLACGAIVSFPRAPECARRHGARKVVKKLKTPSRKGKTARQANSLNSLISANEQHPEADTWLEPRRKYYAVLTFNKETPGGSKLGCSFNVSCTGLPSSVCVVSCGYVMAISVYRFS